MPKTLSQQKKEAAVDSGSYSLQRAVAYDPVEEQIGRLTKALAYLKDQGIDIGPDGEAQVAHVNQVKSMYPK